MVGKKNHRDVLHFVGDILAIARAIYLLRKFDITPLRFVAI